MKHWTPRKRPGEMADTARISKAAKVRPEDIKVKVQTKEVKREKDILQSKLK